MRVLDSLGISKEFDGVYSVEDFGCNYKPSLNPYIYLMNTLNLQPSCTVMIDDVHENLETAKSLGINTIHVSELN